MARAPTKNLAGTHSDPFHLHPVAIITASHPRPISKVADKAPTGPSPQQVPRLFEYVFILRSTNVTDRWKCLRPPLNIWTIAGVSVRRATAKFVRVSVGSDAGLQAVGVHVTCACACIAHAAWDCCGRAVIISTSQQTTLGSVVCRSCGSAKSWR